MLAMKLSQNAAVVPDHTLDLPHLEKLLLLHFLHLSMAPCSPLCLPLLKPVGSTTERSGRIPSIICHFEHEMDTARSDGTKLPCTWMKDRHSMFPGRRLARRTMHVSNPALKHSNSAHFHFLYAALAKSLNIIGI